MMISRTILVLGLSILIQACSVTYDPYDASPRIYPDIDQSEITFLKKYPNRATREGSVLNLRFKNAATFTFENVDAKGDECFSSQCESAWVVGYWPDKDSFLLDVSYYEGWDSALVSNDQTVTRIAGRPIHSPNLKYFAAFIDGCGALLETLEVWDFSGSKPVLVFESKGADGVYEVKWKNDTSLEVSTDPSGACGHRSINLVRHVELHADGTWRW